MKSITASLILSFFLLSFVENSVEYEAPVLRAKNGVKDKYIVVFKKEATRDQVKSAMRTMQTRESTGKVDREFPIINGFSASMSKNSLEQLRNNENVEYIEQQQVFRVAQDNCLQQSNSDWGIARVGNGKHPNTYIYPGNAGEGVTAYILDTGVDGNHRDLKPRVEHGASFAFSLCGKCDDQGHGTMVASALGGTNLGIAKKVKIVSVKVMNFLGMGTTDNIISGIQYSANRPLGIINLSLGGGKSQALNDACEHAVKRGHVVVVAAGNSGEDACNVSPASTPNVFTVGASDKNDNFANFSNFGKCVDAIAPGVDILLATKNLLGFIPMPNRRASGTSFSSPITGGVFCLHKANCTKCSPSELTQRVLGSVEMGRIKGLYGDTPDAFVHSDCPLPLNG